MAELGYDVLGFDVDEAKIARLCARARCRSTSPASSRAAAQERWTTGRLRFTTSYAEAADFGDVHFVCVGTPQRKGEYAADLSLRRRRGRRPRPAPRPRQCLVVGKSTVPVGTAARLPSRLAELAPAGASVELAWNPEFLREGFAVEDTLRPGPARRRRASAARAEAMLRAGLRRR